MLLLTEAMKSGVHRVLIIFFIIPKTQIVGTRKNLLIEAVCMSTHNLCFGKMPF